MKLLGYYLAFLFPLPLLYLVAKQMNALTFVTFLVFYIIFKSILDFNKLIEKGLIKKNEYWKSIIPFFKVKYFKELYTKS
jgi:uncharacterized membrane protein